MLTTEHTPDISTLKLATSSSTSLRVAGTLKPTMWCSGLTADLDRPLQWAFLWNWVSSQRTYYSHIDTSDPLKGPCRVTSANSTEPFPYSWNEHANIFFIDQPVGVGFSYAEYGEYVDNTLDAGDDVAAFMVVFFEHFTQFKGRPVHLTGESYAVKVLSSCVLRCCLHALGGSRVDISPYSPRRYTIRIHVW